MEEQPQDNIAHDFDADTYMKSEGMTFIKKNEDGTAHIAYEDGTEGNLDPRAIAKEHGFTPAEKFDVTYNSPDAPINESPVGVIDRLKLSVGNTKGGVAYLKSKFEGATVSASGEMLVKDKGVWKRVDLDGISNDDGWSASELLGDIADLGGDAIVGAGSLVGAVVGGAGTAGVGAIAGSAVGSGVASAGKAVLGRFAGTFDATPQEFATDVIFDTFLGAVGEGVAIGAKAYLGPTMKRGLKAITNMGEGVQNAMASALAAVDGSNGVGTWREAIANPKVISEVAKFNDMAAEQALKSGRVGADLVKEGFDGETASTIKSRLLYKNAADAAAPLIEEAQTKMSNAYGTELKSIFSENMDSAVFKEAQTKVPLYAKQATEQFDGFLSDNGLLEFTKTTKAAGTRESSSLVSKNGGEFLPSSRASINSTSSSTTKQLSEASSDSVLAWAKKGGNLVMDKEGAADIAKALNGVRNNLAELSNNGLKTPSQLQDAMKMPKVIQDLIHNLPHEQAALIEASMENRLGNIHKTMSNMMPKEMAERHAVLSSNYQRWKSSLAPVLSGTKGINATQAKTSLASSVYENFRAVMQGAPSKLGYDSGNVLQVLKEINPDQLAHFQKLRLADATQAVGGMTSASALSASGAVSRAMAFGAKKVGVPVAQVVSKMQRKASLKGFINTPGYSQFMGAAGAIKNGGASVLNNPELLGAGLTAMMSGLRTR